MNRTAEKTSYKNMLKSNIPFRKIFIAQSISVLGDWFNEIALLGLVYSLTQSGLMVSLTLIARALPALFLSPFIGVLVDKFNRKKL